MNEDTFTLEEAIDGINDFLNDRLNNFEESTLDKNVKAFKKAMPQPNYQKSLNEIQNKHKILTKRMNPNRAGAHIRPVSDEEIEDMRAIKSYSGIGKTNMPKEREAGKYLKMQLAKKKAVAESVEDILNQSRLNVFDAFEAGLIDEDEKYNMLEMLNLENYE